MKKIVAVLLSIIMALSFISAGVITAFASDASGTCGSSLSWFYDDTSKTLSISGTGEMTNYSYFGSSTAPWYKYNDQIEHVSIGSGVTTFSEYLFIYCSNLKDFSISADNANFCSVDGVVFSKAKDKFIVYPRGKSGTTYSIPNSVVSIEENAFYGCKNLVSVDIPDSVNSYISWYAFRYCTSLTSINIPDKVTSIGKYTFDGCTSLTSVTIGNGVTEIMDYAFNGCTSLKEIKIPSSVTDFGEYIFSGCTSLESVVFCSGITNIPDYCFNECTALSSITIPKSITQIGYSALSSCSKLSDVYYEGSESEKELIYTCSGNNPVYAATWHFNSSVPSTPVTAKPAADDSTEDDSTENNSDGMTLSVWGAIKGYFKTLLLSLAMYFWALNFLNWLF